MVLLVTVCSNLVLKALDADLDYVIKIAECVSYVPNLSHVQLDIHVNLILLYVNKLFALH